MDSVISTNAQFCDLNVFTQEDLTELNMISGLPQFNQYTATERQTNKINVFVSCFAASWMTAACLYCKGSIELTLYVTSNLHDDCTPITPEFVTQQHTLFKSWAINKPIIEQQVKIQFIRKPDGTPWCYAVLDLNMLINNKLIAKNLYPTDEPIIYRIMYQNKTVNKFRTEFSEIKRETTTTIRVRNELQDINTAASKTERYYNPLTAGKVIYVGYPCIPPAPATAPATQAAPAKKVWEFWKGGSRRLKKRSVRRKRRRSRQQK